MREIKFRGKTASWGWIYSRDIRHIGNDVFLNDEKYLGDDGCFMTVDPDTVGQYTGMKDANGREIYEGDIVQSYVFAMNEDEEIIEFWRVGEIRFCQGGFVLMNCTNYDTQDRTIKSDIQPSKQSKNRFPSYRSEIIGNIYDNPELLKGGAK